MAKELNKGMEKIQLVVKVLAKNSNFSFPLSLQL